MGGMMANQGKKMAAALAAVSLYLQQEEAMAAEKQQALPACNSQHLDFSQWGQSGRQEMMAMRKLIQLRAFTRF
jgi:hypothetical protein